MSGIILRAVAAVVASAGLASAEIYECAADGRPTILSGPGDTAPAGCRRVEAGTFTVAVPSVLDLAERLDEQEAAIQGLAQQVETLKRLMMRPAVRQPPLPSLGSPLTGSSSDRLRDLGQDIDRKLDALSDERRGLGR